MRSFAFFNLYLAISSTVTFATQQDKYQKILPKLAVAGGIVCFAIFSFYLAFDVFEKKDDRVRNVAMGPPVGGALKRKAYLVPPSPRAKRPRWIDHHAYQQFETLNKAWEAVPDEERIWLFRDSKSNISYASLAKFNKSHYNAVMKRIEMQKVLEPQLFRQEIETVSKMNDDDSFQYGKSLDDKIGYIALRNDKHFFAPEEGNEETVEGLQRNALAKFKDKYPNLIFQTHASHWLYFDDVECGARYI